MIGFGWLGQAHTRSLLRIPTLFDDAGFKPELVVCVVSLAQRRELALDGFGFGSAEADWRAAIDNAAVDVVYIAAPNMLHLELIEAAAVDKHIFVKSRSAARRRRPSEQKKQCGDGSPASVITTASRRWSVMRAI